jgi:hypothetical protein
MSNPSDTQVDPRDLPYEATIAELNQRLRDAKAKLVDLERVRMLVAELQDELDWWTRGRDRYASGPTAESAPDEPDPTPVKPTLARAIVTIVGTAQPGKTAWSVAEIMAQLRDRGWMPNGDSAEHVVRARTAQLARGEHPSLRRVEHGVYALNGRPTVTIEVP